MLEAGEVFGIKMFDPLGPFPPDHDSSIHLTFGVLWMSEKLGKHEVKQKYSGVCKVRMLSTHLFNVTARGIQESLFLKTDKHRWVAMTVPSESP